MGSLLILTGRGDEAGGGVLLDTFRCGRTPLCVANDVGIEWLPQVIEPSPMSFPMLKSWAPKDDRAPE